MGLDQSLYIVDMSKEDATPRYEIMYFRKFNALQGWMEDLYRSKGGTEEFNCVAVELTGEDLNRLYDDLNNNRLEPRSGFFLWL